MQTMLIRIISILSWTTTYFMPHRSIKKYIPVTIFSTFITMTVTFIGHHYGFWKVRGNSKKRMWNLVSLILGPFSIATLWTFHLTFGKFRNYLLFNIINNLLYIFGVIPFLAKVNFLKYAKFSKPHHFFIAIMYSLILYKYQMIYDKPDSNKSMNERILEA